ncbi:MAG: hypothetical protein GX053_03080 [Tissierella sp.]|nr:hypothetical protein [Tissierella sp.]
MKKESSSFKYIKTERGFMLITILMVLAVITIFGISLLSVTASNFKQTGVERNFQSVYYIAEAGINNVIYDIGIKVDELSSEELSHEDFFDELNKFIVEYMEDGVKILDNFEESFGEKPVAEITVEDDDVGLVIIDEGTQTKGTINYIIKSVGKIGSLRRTVSTSIEVGHGIEKEKESSRHPAFDYVLYSPKALSLPNQSIIDGSIYSKDIVLKSAGTQISGDLISLTFVDIMGNGTHPRVKGDVYALSGYVYVSTGGLATVEGDVNANGNVIVGSSGTIGKNLYSNGSVELKPDNAKILGNLHAKGDVILGSGTFVGKSIFLNKNLKLLNSNSIINENVFAGKDIYMGNNTFILGDSQAGGSINQHNIDNVNMIISPQNKPISPQFDEIPLINTSIPLYNFDIGNKNLELEPNWKNPNVQFISPGTYKNLIIKGENTVRFVNGDYYFDNIDANEWNVKLQLDLSEGPINIYVKNDLKFSGANKSIDGISVSIDSKNFLEVNKLLETNRNLAVELAGKVYWEVQNNFSIGNRNWFGSVLSNNNFTVGDSPTIIGAYIVNNGTITFGNNPKIIYAPPTDSAAGSSSGTGGSGSPNNKGQNTISPKNRISTSSPIREK